MYSSVIHAVVVEVGPSAIQCPPVVSGEFEPSLRKCLACQALVPTVGRRLGCAKSQRSFIRQSVSRSGYPKAEVRLDEGMRWVRHYKTSMLPPTASTAAFSL